MTATKAEATSTNELLKIVLSDEKENGCADRNKLNLINGILLKREGKTSFDLLTEKEL